MITTNGKEIDIVVAPNSQHYKVQFKTGGELPVELSGLFTSYKNALIAVAVYLNKRLEGKKHA
jgi:hypothetical protein